MPDVVKCALLEVAIEAHENAVETLDQLVAGLSDEQINWKPEPKTWSIAECIDHLNQGLATYVPRMTPKIEKAHAKGKTGAAPYGRGTFTGRFIVNFLKKPSKKAPAPKAFKPSASVFEVGDVTDRFRENTRRFIALAEQADGLPLGKIKMGTPVSPMLRVSLAQAFELHTLHTPRHLGQAQRVKDHDDFPD